ncbi:9205_t:CDS:1, partial [Paraglomus occultum]
NVIIKSGSLRNALWKLCYDTHQTQLAVVPTKRSYEEAIGLDSLVVISEEHLFEFDREWHQHKINLLCSPPASGKTTFAKRFKLYTKDNSCVVWHISMTHVSDIPSTMENKDSFNAAWKKFAGETWTNCLHSTEPTDILIDEAQMLYDKAPFFWNDINIKGLQDYPNTKAQLA